MSRSLKGSRLESIPERIQTHANSSEKELWHYTNPCKLFTKHFPDQLRSSIPTIFVHFPTKSLEGVNAPLGPPFHLVVG